MSIIKSLLKFIIFIGLEICAFTCFIAGGVIVATLGDAQSTPALALGIFFSMSLILGGLSQFFAAFCLFKG